MSEYVSESEWMNGCDCAERTAPSVRLDMKGDLRDLIVDYVEDMGGAIDLLVMGTRGIQGNLKRAVLGSVSSYCLVGPSIHARHVFAQLKA